MNPYGDNTAAVNQSNSKWNFNKQSSSNTLNTNFTDDSLKNTPKNCNYPIFNDVENFPKFNAVPPKRKCESDNDLLQFTPVERYQAADKKKSYFQNNNSVKKDFDDIVNQLFN